MTWVVDDLWFNLGVVLFFIVLGGLFAGTELALVSLRESQLVTLERRGKRGQAVARLARDPNTFLAAVQIGVTVSGFFSAAFGATALAPYLSEPLSSVGVDPEVAGTVGVVTLTLVVAYLSLVFGELAPKRLALQRAEQIALFVAPVLAGLAKVLTPLIWLVGKSSDAVVRLMGGDPDRRNDELSEEELASIVESHESLDSDQREILSDVLDAAGQTVVAVMRPRADVCPLRADMSIAEAREFVKTQPYSRYPVITRNLDDCESFVHVRDLAWHSPDTDTVGSLARSIPLLPGSMRVIPALSHLRAEGIHIALVVDEYGGTDGLVTLEDLVEELIGEVFDEHDPADRMSRYSRSSGADTVSGDISFSRCEELTGVALPPGPYATLAGYIMAVLGRIPRVGDHLTLGDWLLEVVDMEERRVVGVRVSRPEEVKDPAASEG